MNKFAKIVLNVGISVIFFGGVLCAGSIATGKVDFGSLSIGKTGNKKINDTSEKSSKVKTQNNKYDIERKEIDAYDKFYIDADAVNMNVVKGDKFEIEYHGDWKPVYKCENGKFIFELRGNRNINIQDLKSLANPNSKINKLTVYIPESASFKSGKIEADAGSVEVSGLKSAQLKVEADVGNVDIKSCDIGKMDIGSDAGNVDIYDLKSKELKIESDAGNVRIRSSNINKINTKADAGNITVNNSTLKSIKAEIDTGNIKLLNITADTAKLGTNMGNIKVKINGKRDDYDIKLDNSLGTAKINGKKVENFKEDTGKSKKIKLESDIGNVKLSFK